jgi:DNA invertase Pin-like site-specific DNA recombinase
MGRVPAKELGSAEAKVYGYTRVSVVRGGEDAESLEVQRRKIEGRALQDGVKLIRIFVERGVSGSRPLNERPQGKVLLAGVKPGDVVIASKLDRMFRSATDALRVLEDFKRRRISLVLLDLGGNVTTDGIARLVFTILSGVAQFERERIGERIRETKAHLRESGRYLGGARPFGYLIGADGALEPERSEQQAITIMRRLRNNGKSLRVIRDALNAKGVMLSHVAVRRILAAEEYHSDRRRLHDA